MTWGFGTATALIVQKTNKLAKTCNRMRMFRAYLRDLRDNKVSSHKGNVHSSEVGMRLKNKTDFSKQIGPTSQRNLGYNNHQLM
jgi:hypothetical protein